MKLKDLCDWLDAEVPLAFQEDYDNSGLQVGEPDQELSRGLLTIDVTEEVIEEAISNNCDIVISHHPLIFGGLKRLAAKTPVERIVRKCILNNIAVYSAHTNLDIAHSGVSRKMAEKLGLEDIRVLSPLRKQLTKLVTFIPVSHVEQVSSAVFRAGAGVIGNYDSCGFTVQGKGSFRGNEKTNPFAGEKNQLHYEDEARFETVLFTHMKDKVVRALLEAHPYEEVAYDLYSIDNTNIDAGLGCTGNLPEAAGEHDFLRRVLDLFGPGLRYSGRTKSGEVIKVAVCGGSGASLLKDALSSGADAFITADIRYHSFFEAENRILLIDAGHYQTEKFSVELIKELITKKFPKFALRFSNTNTNPINYIT
jgi:dinuclear metal center YbgI/SA1388 family protein